LRRAARTRRVLRGGSFNNNRNNARCAYRNNNNPDNRNNNIGFRVCVSTSLLFMPEMQYGYGCIAEAFKDGAGNVLTFCEERRI